MTTQILTESHDLGAERTWFLGGNDLEMAAIRQLLNNEGQTIVDKSLRWGASAKCYADEITACLNRGAQAILVELGDVAEVLAGRKNAIVVDHHGPDAGKNSPTALEQVFQLLGLPAEKWTRDFSLIAANDRAYVMGLRETDATRDEILDIRRRDRAAQPVIPAATCGREMKGFGPD